MLLLVMVLVRMSTDNKAADRNMGIMYWPGKATITKTVKDSFAKILLKTFLSKLFFFLSSSFLCHCEFMSKAPDICFMP